MKKITKFIVIMLTFLFGSAAYAQEPNDKVSIELIPQYSSISNGSSELLGIKMKPAPGWHTYWVNPGETGLAPEFKFEMPQGFSTGAFQWPAPQKLIYQGLVTYGYESDSTILVPLTNNSGIKDGQSAAIKVHGEILVCKDICLPQSVDAQINLKIGANDKTDALLQTKKQIPSELKTKTEIVSENGKTKIIVSFPHSKARETFKNSELKDVFFADQSAFIAKADYPKTRKNDSYVFEFENISPDAIKSVPLVLQFANNETYSINATNTKGESSQDVSLNIAIFMAFIGGMILNLMPCVFPILAMKIISLSKAGHNAKEGRIETLLYGVGSIFTFLILAGFLEVSRIFGQNLGWGFQLQLPWVTGLMAFLLLLVSLNMAGLFETGSNIQSIAGNTLSKLSGSPRMSAFMTGVLAVVIAAPCSAPFMATAIGVALTNGGFGAGAIFLALGIGFALPFVVLGLLATSVPAIAEKMPRPGPWMDKLRKGLSLPMFAATAWMLWIFANQTALWPLIILIVALILVSIALIVHKMPNLARGIIALSALPLGGFAALNPDLGVISSKAIQSFSTEEISTLQSQNKPILVDLTADWCITCKVNEKLVLKSDAIQIALKKSGTVYLIGDWTRRDDKITSYLKQFGRSGVPLYVYYGPNNSKPIILPQILDKATLEKTLLGK